MRVQLLSFGHKYGTPRDLELMFDVRHLPNPYFVPELSAHVDATTTPKAVNNHGPNGD